MSLLAMMLVAADTADGVQAPAPAHPTWAIVRTAFVVAIVVSFTIWVFIQAWRRSEEPLLLVFKWAMTIALGAFLWFVLGPMVKEGGYSGMGAMLLVMATGWGLAFVWRRSIAMIIATPFGNLYDGGRQQVEARPFYSPAMSKRKRGYYQEAVADIRKELEKFPADFEGQLLLADIQAENLNDLPGAAVTIQRICNQPGHAPRNVALGLNCLADWYLKYYQDRDAARDALEKIIALLPDSEWAALASQRIGHLASHEHLLARHDPKKFAVVEGVRDLGLLDPKFHPQPASEDAAKQAAELVAHLQSHPLDTDAREKLALIYADHYHRLDLAFGQLEDLIAHPSQPARRVVHWLNLLADLQIRNGMDYDAVRATVQRIIDLFPGAPVAEVAASRITLLKLELKGKEKSQSVKLGTYEQDIGLKK